MGRAPCCDKANVKKGPWSPEEDEKLKEYIHKHGTGGNWIALPQKVGLRRCGKSCRLRWLNYLRPNIKHGEFSDEEDRLIINLFANIGSRWSIIAAQLPGRTDNDIKNYWNTKLKKKLVGLINNKQQQQQQQAKPNIISSSSSPSSSHHLITNTNNNSCMNIMQHFNNYQESARDNTRASFMVFDQASSSDGRSISYTNNITMVTNDNNNHNNNGIITWGGSTSTSSVITEDHHHHHHQQQQYQYQANDDSNIINTNSVLDYGLEEINELISSTSSTNNNNNNNNNDNSSSSSCLWEQLFV